MKLAGFRVELETISPTASNKEELAIDDALDELNIEEMREVLKDYFAGAFPKEVWKRIAIKVYDEQE